MLNRLASDEWRPAGALGLVVLAVYVAAGQASVSLGQAGSFAPTVWPGGAVALVLMLRWRPSWRSDVSVMSAVLAGSLLLHHGNHLPAATAAGFACVNLAALLVQVWLARRFAPDTFRAPADGWRFAAIVGVPAPLIGGLLIGAIVAQTGAGSPLATARAWGLAEALGFLLVAPFGMTVSRREIARLRLRARLPQAATAFLLVVGTSLVVFVQSRFPLLFLVMPPLLLATFEFRLAGAAAGAAATAAVALVMTGLDSGPMMLIDGSSHERILVVQLFVTTACLTMLPIAAALNQRDRLAAAIERQRLAAIAANEAKSRLLAHVSHEVRSPLSAILNFSAFVSADIDRTHLSELAALIARNGKVLKALADDLIDLHAQETGAFSIKSAAVPVGDALNDIRASLQAQAQSASTDILIRPSPALDRTVAADPRRLRQILANLTSNAIKYGAGHGPVTLQATELPDDFLRVEVANGGPGIPPERQGELFQPFSRAGAEETSVEGAGLGLLLTKQLVEMQGGRIAFESEPNRRTRFWVDLPKAA